MMRSFLPVLFTGLLSLGALSGCQTFAYKPLASSSSSASAATRSIDPTLPMLTNGWSAYRDRFIQADGRIIDREDTDRSISEGQAYALLRAVMADDPSSFATVLQWSENNLKRQTPTNQPIDRLWAWKWGRQPSGQWGPLDPNFATDADIDAITALILASRRWQKPEYLTLARAKLSDLWTFGTVAIANERYLLPGPIAAFQRDGILRFNPSYLAPYAFRLFAQVDPDRDWMKLVDSSYRLLEQSSQVSTIALPSDWIAFNPKTNEYSSIPPSDSLPSRYSFDAHRVWWRIALDADWFQEPRANAYLQQHLEPLKNIWRSQRKLPAQFDLQGRPLVEYEATSQYAMLYPAFQVIDPAIAQEILEQKLIPQYHNGFWDNDSAYYTQNLAWLGLAFNRSPHHALKPLLSSPIQAATTP